MWLVSGLRPKYKTIANFRKNHPKAFREISRRFVWMLKEWKIIDGETVAIDSFARREVYCKPTIADSGTHVRDP